MQSNRSNIIFEECLFQKLTYVDVVLREVASFQKLSRVNGSRKGGRSIGSCLGTMGVHTVSVI